MSGQWTEDILKELNLRDDKEKQNSSYFIAFSQLSQKLHPTTTTTQRPSTGTDSSASSSSSPSPSPSLTSPNSKQKQTTTPLDDFTIKENQNLKVENNELIQSLNLSTITNEKLEGIIHQQSSIIKSLENKNTKLKNKIDGLVLEIKEKNKTIELINDEILTNQIQFNVLRDKLERLEKQ
ncbi:Autophagy protein 16 [Candida viswanathii]|uniref:Autophagy protein 16 n=1 Tax=Candida viswanathii TaxID=5486 RepID=A0A367YHN3_9ASCO|nr:Autophagy protein 16 [Candida viswanathii]